MTVLGFERFPVDPGGEQRFLDLIGELLKMTRAAGGVLWADAARAFDDDPSYLLISEWRTAADADAWLEGAEAQGFRDRADEFLRGEITRRRLRSD